MPHSSRINKVGVQDSVVQSCLTLCGPMDYIAHPAPLFMGFSKQEYWSGLSSPTPGDLPNPAIEQAHSLPLVPPGKPKVGGIFK